MKGLMFIVRKYKMASFLNVLGLTVAFSVFYVLLIQITDQLNHNKGLKDWEQLYRVENTVGDGDWAVSCNRPLPESVAELPQVEELALWCGMGGCYVDLNGTAMYMSEGLMLPGTLETLGAKCIDGRLSPHTGEEGVIIPVSFAKKYFGETMVAGRGIQLWKESKQLTVIGVYEDFPKNCDVENYCFRDMGDRDQNRPNNFNYTCFVRLKEGTDSKQMDELLTTTLHKLYIDWGTSNGYQVTPEIDAYIKKFKSRLVSVDKTYFSNVDLMFDKGNKGILLVLEIIALLVILVSAINFTNFTLAESPVRMRGIMTRKVMGSSTWSLRMGLMGENVLLSLSAFLLALLLIALLESSQLFSEMLQASLVLTEHVDLILLLLVVAIGVGILTSLYPSWYVTSFPPAMALKGSFGLSPNGRRLRGFLIALQLIVSFTMVGYLGILWSQKDYFYSSDYGFDKEQILYGNMYGVFPLSQAETVRQELVKIPGVEDVSYSRFTLGMQTEVMTWSRTWGENPDDQYYFKVFPVDEHFLRTYGIKLVEGRDFNAHDRNAYIINEAMKRKYPRIAIDEPFFKGSSGKVVGICEDLRFCSVHVDNINEPAVFVVMNQDPKEDDMGMLSIRLAAGMDKFKLRKEIERTIMCFADMDPDLYFYDERIESVYRDEVRFMTQINWFALIALVITLIGVFCLTMFETEYRRKEIGIRKVMGASVTEIIEIFLRYYLKLILIGFIPSVPIAYLFGKEWLQNFAEQTPIYWWIFVVSFVSVSIIVLLTVIVQSWRVANDNPINSIKTE